MRTAVGLSLVLVMAAALPGLAQSAEHPFRLARKVATIAPSTPINHDYQPAPRPIEQLSADPQTLELERQMWERVNDDRAKNGAPAIRLDPELSNLARKYAEYMMNNSFFAHVDPRGRNPQDRAREAGITFGVYENIAMSEANFGNDIQRLQEQERDMMAEPRGPHNHRYNILLPQHTAVGIGIARDGERTYMVQEYIDR